MAVLSETSIDKLEKFEKSIDDAIGPNNCRWPDQWTSCNGSLHCVNGYKAPSTDYIPLDVMLNKRMSSGDPFFSLEFFPPRTLSGVTNLLSRIDRMGEGSPLFVDVTWHESSDPSCLAKPTSSVSMAGACLNHCGQTTVLHVTCAYSTRDDCARHLRSARQLGVRNVLALRGDWDAERRAAFLAQAKGDDGSPPCILSHGAEFVRAIKQQFGDYFVIIVAGYPTGHPEAESYDADLRHLKEKVDAGASFIITQLFFYEKDFFKFVQDCREIGITVPIIPGVLPIQSYDSLRHMQKLSKLNVPQFIFDEVESVKQNDEAVRKYGVDFAVKMCQKLLKSGLVSGIHFYTLNRELATREIVQQLGMWKEPCARTLPWKSIPAHPKRCRETVRPIFWASRPKAYLHRTRQWDEFPNGRWGNSSSPAFGDLKDYYLFYSKQHQPKDHLVSMWGGPDLRTEEEVWRVFVDFIKGQPNERGVKVDRLPWGEESVAQETFLVQNELAWCNENGILTINSQPNINGAISTDPVVGWGSPNGYVYQKAYLEFFMNQRHLNSLKLALYSHPLINFHIINHDGSIDLTNSDYNNPLAVTWGVFPGCEIAQPTVVDPISFHVWKDEAFNAWITQWANLYESDSESRKLIHDIHNSYCLVTLVDNDYPRPCILWPLLDQMLKITDRLIKAPLEKVDQESIDVFDRSFACTVENGIRCAKSGGN